MTETNNMVIGLSDQITRVSAKAERWRGYMKEMPEMAQGMSIGLKVMEAEIDRARKALASGDLLQMIPAYHELKGYSDDD